MKLYIYKRIQVYVKAIIIGLIIGFLYFKISERINAPVPEVVQHKKAGDWKVVSTEYYYRNNKQCKAYRVYISKDYAGYSEYRDIFEYLTKKDSYYLHIVWFFFNKSRADGSEAADRIMEQEWPNDTPSVKDNKGRSVYD